MKKLITVYVLLMGIGSVAAKAELQLNQPLPSYNNPGSPDFVAGSAGQLAKAPIAPSSYVPKSSGLPSLDFAKRFGKHCTSHKNMFGRQVSGLCDDAGLCSNPAQYKACYKHCIQERKKEDEKTMYIFGKLASCKVNSSDKESLGIFNQANLRLKQARRQHVSSKTFEMPVDTYQVQRTEGIRSSTKSLNPFSANCTSHKNLLGKMTAGICDNGKQCNTANYKKCYNECVVGRPVDDKTYYVLKNLLGCRVNASDLELGNMSKDVKDKYFKYEMTHAPAMLKSNNQKDPSRVQSMPTLPIGIR